MSSTETVQAKFADLAREAYKLGAEHPRVILPLIAAFKTGRIATQPLISGGEIFYRSGAGEKMSAVGGSSVFTVSGVPLDHFLQTLAEVNTIDLKITSALRQEDYEILIGEAVKNPDYVISDSPNIGVSPLKYVDDASAWDIQDATYVAWITRHGNFFGGDTTFSYQMQTNTYSVPEMRKKLRKLGLESKIIPQFSSWRMKRYKRD